MALQAIDHIVIMVADLAAAVRDYAELGFTVISGSPTTRPVPFT